MLCIIIYYYFIIVNHQQHRRSSSKNYILKDNNRHINILLINFKDRIVERFDTIDQYQDVLYKITKLVTNKLDLNFKIVTPKKFIFNNSRADCGLCVPLSYLYIYLRIKFNIKLEEVIKLISSYNNENLFSISSEFVNYLNLK